MGALVTEAAQYWYVYARGVYCGKALATRAEVLAAVGPWVVFRGNAIDVFAPPPRARSRRA